MDPETPLEKHFRLTKPQKSALKRLGLATLRDLLFYFPRGYGTPPNIRSISELAKGETATIYAKVGKLEKTKAFRSRVPLTRGTAEDTTGKIRLVWFHQPYIAEMLPEGALVELRGKVAADKKGIYFANPEVESLRRTHYGAGPETETPRRIPPESALFSSNTARNETPLSPMYAETHGVTSRWFFYAVKKLLASGLPKEIADPLPPELLKKYSLPSLQTALFWIHQPKNARDAESARKRFSFEEIFFIQLNRRIARRAYQANPTFSIAVRRDALKEFLARFSFAFTPSQKKATEAILSDFKEEKPMTRLLEGDVGSGKTAVAAATAYTVATSRPHTPDGTRKQDFGNLQTALMAPTEILAQQHFESFIELFKGLPIQIGLITGSGCKKFPSKVPPKIAGPRESANWTSIPRDQLLKWTANGEIPILIGTHALIQKHVAFKDLAYVVIDEQHRFGVNQRKALMRRFTQNKRGTTRMEDSINNNELLYKDLTYTIRGIVFSVKNALGPGHKESVYQNAFEEELKKRNIPYKREAQLPVHYNNKRVGYYQPDFLVNGKVIIELKALPRISNQNIQQIWNYLKGTRYALALLINFGADELFIKRIVFETARRNQRASASVPRESAQQEVTPHLLSMTATPIPRTLALTIYGDLDLTLLTDMPPGRKPVKTEVVLPNERGAAYEKVRRELAAGRQVYVICPRIDPPDGEAGEQSPAKELALNAKSVKEESERLKKEVFPEYEIGILHSKLKPKEKEEIMERFAGGEIAILVATSVVEVGVNVPNATTIIIEGAERFGLAQLHQLRGRVLRSTHQAYCFIFSDSKSKKTLERLKALGHAKNGFELAERDLTLRGPGELSGRQQWGISDIGMEAIKNIKMVEAAREEAETLLKADTELMDHPLIKERVEQMEKELHFE